MLDPTDNLDDGTYVARLMERWYLAIIETAWGDTQLLGVPVAFDLDNPFVQTVRDRLAHDIQRITETTKDEIRTLVAKQAAEGWSIEELARRIQERGEIASQTRATRIARTESGQAYNLGAIASYRAAGLTHVRVLDGDEDEPCASANGATWTLDEADAHPLGHPNCTRSFSPIVSLE